MLQKVSRAKQFVIYQSSRDYIIHNLDIPDKNNHAHLNHLSTAQYLIRLSLSKSIDKSLPIYLLKSLIQINNDPYYIKRINSVIASKSKNPRKYSQ